MGTGLGRALSLAVWVAVTCGCHPEQYRIAVVPSLRPVDPSRPKVIFARQLGHACGRDAVAGALQDLKRIAGVDGFLEVVIEGTGEGDQRCVRAWAYPFRYGCLQEEPGVGVGPEPAKVFDPGDSQPPPGCGEQAKTCVTACAEAAALIEPEGLKQAMVRDRCAQRCKQREPAFEECIEAVTSAAEAQACLALPESGAAVPSSGGGAPAGGGPAGDPGASPTAGQGGTP